MLEPLPGGSESAALRLTVLKQRIASVSAEQIRQALLPVTDLSAEPSPNPQRRTRSIPRSWRFRRRRPVFLRPGNDKHTRCPSRFTG